jgi:hypothetical protein
MSHTTDSNLYQSPEQSNPTNALSSSPAGKTLDPKEKRLVQWNVEILAKLLKKIITNRSGSSVDSKGLSLVEKRLFTKESSIFAEVEATMTLSENLNGTDLEKRTSPYFNQNKGNKFAVNDGVITDKVHTELNDYVTQIALLHCNNNAFHNFEHASHRIIATSKLLKRLGNVQDSTETKQEVSTFNATKEWLCYDPLTQFAVVFAALIHDVYQ